MNASLSTKLMVAFRPETFNVLDGQANQRGVTVQELLRAVIIPEWFKSQGIDLTPNHRSGARPASNNNGSGRENLRR